MIKLLVGVKGSGKTKKFVEMVNESVPKVKGNIVCIEKGMKLTYDLDRAVRLVDMDEYKVDSLEKFTGFFAGILAGNYDIEEIYVDGILRVDGADLEGFGKLLESVDALAPSKVVLFTVSAAEDTLPDSVKKYL